jgi:3-deoxy-D-manno-octulosonic-acid transferase
MVELPLLRLWSGAATLAAPVLRVRLRRRAARGKEVARRLPERYGHAAFARPPGRLIWLHAASVGETVSVLPVISAILLADTAASVLLTTGTVTSAQLFEERAPSLADATRVLHQFVPLDVPSWAGRFLDHWRPDAAGFVESELWPNLLLGARTRGVPMMLINARLSARSAANWARAPATARRLLGCFTRIEAQSAADAERFAALGGTSVAANVAASGNLKFAADALPADPAEYAGLSALIAGRPTWLAASTQPEDDAPVAAIHTRLIAARPDALTIVAPRHPERGPAVVATMGGAARRALGQGPDGPVWVADTLGELGLLYRLAPVVLMGKSLLPPGGGQNPLEPARLGCAVAMGPYDANFAEASARLAASGGLARVADVDAVVDWVLRMWSDETARGAAGAAARAAADRDAELPARIADALLALAGG